MSDEVTLHGLPLPAVAPQSDPKRVRSHGELSAKLAGPFGAFDEETIAGLARAVRGMAESVHTPIEVHLFSDMQRSELAATFSDMALPANAKVVTHAVVTKAQPNWTVESIDAPGDAALAEGLAAHGVAHDDR